MEYIQIKKKTQQLQEKKMSIRTTTRSKIKRNQREKHGEKNGRHTEAPGIPLCWGQIPANCKVYGTCWQDYKYNVLIFF